MKSTQRKAETWGAAVDWLRAQPGHAQLVRDCYYDEPILGAAERYHASPEWTEARHWLGSRRGDALDFGAGRGVLSFALAKDGWNVRAIEPDPDESVGLGAIHRVARDGGVTIDARLGVGEKLPFPDASFDLVIGRQVLHHISDLPLACQEAFRVLRPGGQFFALREPVLSEKKELLVFLANHPLSEIYDGENALLLSEYRDAIVKAGLEIVRELTPYESEINLYPARLADVRKHFVKQHLGRYHLARLTWLIAPFAPRSFLRKVGELDRTPGRLYTFIARKPART